MRIEIEVKDENVESALDVAGTSYWCSSWGRTPEGRLFFVEADGGDGEPRTITVIDRYLVRGIALMAEKCPREFAELLADGGDANTGDVLAQLCCFGEIKYG
jgi:hypothetical protein